MRILTILARFGTVQYADADQQIDEIFRRQLPAVERRVLIVDNSLPRDLVEDRGASVLLGGDNSAREFSAFDRAIEFAGSELGSYDFIHFATSAFNTLYTAYLDRFSTTLLLAIGGRPICLGHIDAYNEPIALLGIRSQHWIRSCFFFLPPSEVRALGSFVSIRDRHQFFTGDPGAPFRQDAPLSLRYQSYISEWLTGGDIGQGVTWHSSFALSAATLRSFEEKTTAILNEQMLGIRLRAIGCPLVDVTWLAAALSQPGIAAATRPDWRQQIANRDRDAVMVT